MVENFSYSISQKDKRKEGILAILFLGVVILLFIPTVLDYWSTIVRDYHNNPVGYLIAILLIGAALYKFLFVDARYEVRVSISDEGITVEEANLRTVYKKNDVVSFSVPRKPELGYFVDRFMLTIRSDSGSGVVYVLFYRKDRQKLEEVLSKFGRHS